MKKLVAGMFVLCLLSSIAFAQVQEEETWSEGLPPNGVWRVEVSQEDLVRQGLSTSTAREWAGTFTYTFEDDNVTMRGQFVDPPIVYQCEATAEVVEDFVRFTWHSGSGCEGSVDELKWRLDGDGLHFQALAFKNAPFAENAAYHEAKPWQKVE